MPLWRALIFLYFTGFVSHLLFDISPQVCNEMHTYTYIHTHAYSGILTKHCYNVTATAHTDRADLKTQPRRPVIRKYFWISHWENFYTSVTVKMQLNYTAFAIFFFATPFNLFYLIKKSKTSSLFAGGINKASQVRSTEYCKSVAVI